MWIKSYSTIGSHPKLAKLCFELGISEAQAVGHLHYLWWFACEYTKDGNVMKFGNETLVKAAKYPVEKADEFVKALKSARWLDDDGKIHDWEEHIEPTIAMFEANRKRQRDFRKKSASENAVKPKSERPHASHVAPDDPASKDGEPTAEMAEKWRINSVSLGSNYTPDETRTAFLAMKANGFKWAQSDWRAGLERQIQMDRQRNQKTPGSSNKTDGSPGSQLPMWKRVEIATKQLEEVQSDIEDIKSAWEGKPNIPEQVKSNHAKLVARKKELKEFLKSVEASVTAPA